MSATSSPSETLSQKEGSAIKQLDVGSVHKITSGQVVVDLQTAVKELVENSLDAGATNIEVRFKEYGLESFEVIDNGSGIRPEDYDSIALKHHTSKLSSFSDLENVATFGFRGEALSSICALADSVTVTTATTAEAPVGTVIEFERSGKVKSRKGKAARQRGTTVTVSGLFKPLPVRRKELERSSKREFGKALTLLHAYALVPCAKENQGVRLSVTNQTTGGKKSVQLRTDGTPSTRASVSSIWGPKALENLVELDVQFNVEVEASVLRRLGRTQDDGSSNQVQVRGLISKFSVACGRNGTDRQFFFVNGRPCSPSKVQKAFNEVYRSFNATQSPFVIADFVLPTNSCDINVSPDKRTILLHSESNLVQALRVALEQKYAPSRSTFDVNASQLNQRKSDPTRPSAGQAPETQKPFVQRNDSDAVPLFLPDDEGGDIDSSQPDSGLSHSQAESSEHIDVDVDEDEPTFGQPTLLSEPSSSAGGSSSHELNTKDTNYVMDAIEVVPGSDADDSVHLSSTEAAAAAPATFQDDGEGQGEPRGKTRTRLRSESRSMSPTVTQFIKRTVTERVQDVGESAEQPEMNTGSGTVVASIQRHVSPDGSGDDGDDPPIPLLRLPVRPVVRVSPQPALGKKRGEQMVLSTAGASWSLQRGSEQPPRKKSRLETGGQGKQARVGMRELLRGFARTGSQVANVRMDVDEKEGDHEATDKDEDEDEDEAVVDEEKSEENENSPPVLEVEMKDLAEPGPGDSGMDIDDDGESSNAADSAIPEIYDISQEDHVDVPEPPRPIRSHLGESSSSNVTGDEIVRTGDCEFISLALDVSRVVASWEKLRQRLVDATRNREEGALAAKDDRVRLDSATAGISQSTDDEEAAEVLLRVIDKSDFAGMEVVGQFNLGFIIVRRRQTRQNEQAIMDDLFIVDQHAADEKYNFETLQRTTKIDSQKLFRPQVLELTAADEIVAVENIDVLRQNGFELDVSEDRTPGQRMQLTAQPISKGIVFDMKDLEELLHLMQDRPTGHMVRCSKARAMFAMRACRKSIMIGTPLSRRQMTSVIQHMGTMDQPWHCPHGRPTMRYLSDITGIGWDRRGRLAQRIDWAAFGREA